MHFHSNANAKGHLWAYGNSLKISSIEIERKPMSNIASSRHNESSKVNNRSLRSTPTNSAVWHDIIALTYFLLLFTSSSTYAIAPLMKIMNTY